MPYCPSCGDEIDDTVDYCPSCGAAVSAREETGFKPKDGYEHWLVLSPLIAVVGFLFASFSSGFLEGAGIISPVTLDSLTALIVDVYLLSLLLTMVLPPVGVYLERGDEDSWSPSLAYYGSVVPGLNILLAIIYAIQRYEA